MVNFITTGNVLHNQQRIWLEYWKILNYCAKFIIKYVHYVLDIDCQISYNPIKHMSGGCGYGIVGALYGSFLPQVPLQVRGDSLNTHGEHVC